MHSAVVIVALAAGALAVPYKRDVVTHLDVVYATDVVTVFATAAETATVTATASAAPAPAETTSSEDAAAHYGHHANWVKTWTWTSQAAPVTVQSSATYVALTSVPYVAPTTSSAYVAPTTSSAYIAPTTSAPYVAPTSTMPVVASSSSSTWVAPTTTSPISVYVAPTTSSSTSVNVPRSSSSAAAAAPTDYAGIAVLHHNLHRANHSANDVAWSDDLAKSASDIAASCVYAHNVDADGGGYGQNIAAGVESANISAIITDLFYNGEVGWYNGLYGQAQPDMTNFEKWGHFSQIVWKDTQFIGCATQHCPNGLANVGSDVAPYFTVCNYKGPGNYDNEYAKNIGSPLNHATAEWNTGL